MIIDHISGSEIGFRRIPPKPEKSKISLIIDTYFYESDAISNKNNSNMNPSIAGNGMARNVNHLYCV